LKDDKKNIKEITFHARQGGTSECQKQVKITLIKRKKAKIVNWSLHMPKRCMGSGV
jgi:hypothetical protein